MSHSKIQPVFARFVQSASVVTALTACASTEAPQPGSLEAVKQSQFMPIYEQCLAYNAPRRAGRTSTTMLNEVARACMQAAKQAVK